MPNHEQKLVVFDFGVSTGDDTEYYLRQGYEVVGVEANPACLQNTVNTKFAQRVITPSASEYDGYSIEDTAHLYAVAVGMPGDRNKKLPFYVNVHNDAWSAFDRSTACLGHPVFDRNVNHINCHEINVTVVGCDWFVDKHIKNINGNILYAAKIDVEGQEDNCIRGLMKHPDHLPKYLQVETDKRDVTGHLDLMIEAGYYKFKLVNQEYYGKTFNMSSPFDDTSLDINTESPHWRSADDFRKYAKCVGSESWCDIIGKRD